MHERERHSERHRGGGGQEDPDSQDGLNDLRASGERFLEVGDEAIRNALSSDSEAFLRASRQRGGQ